MKNSMLNLEHGRYFFVRSSEHKTAMIGWKRQEFDEQSGRWFEIRSFDFTDQKIADSQREVTWEETRDFAVEHIHIPVRESFCEITRDPKSPNAFSLHAELLENKKHEIFHFLFSALNADQAKIEKLIDIIHCWHDSGILEIEELMRQGCYMSF